MDKRRKIRCTPAKRKLCDYYYIEELETGYSDKEVYYNKADDGSSQEKKD